MPITLQPVLACDKETASDITVFHSRCGTTYEVYIGVALLERVGADPEVVQRKMLVGRLYNAGVTLRELEEKFGHDGRTIKKWAAAILTGDIDAMARAFAGRGGTGKLSPELIRYARQLYRERHRLGKNYREVIIRKIEEVFCVRISSTTASGIFRSVKETAEAERAAEKSATAEQRSAISSTRPSASVKRSPTPLPVQAEDGETNSEELIHHAGQAVFAGEMTGFRDPVERQFIGQILQGAVNVEQSKTVCGRSMSNFTGPVVGGLKEQRDLLDERAGPEAVLAVYKRNAELLVDGPNRGDLFYFDPHTKEYTGQLKVLKGWCGRRHGITKVMNLDTFHTRSGRPCFVQHYSPYYDLRERFFMSRTLFDRLFDEHRRRDRTFVIDRAIYGLAALQSFGEDHVITWEKNYSGGGWDDRRPPLTFVRSRTKNRRDDHRFITFQCQESPWKRDPSFRRIIVRVSREDAEDIQVSVLTSNPHMDVQDVIWAIFRRWIQENDFKYLDTHFGFNQMTSRDSVRFSDRAADFRDRPVDSPEYKELKTALQALDTKLGKRLVQLRKCQKEQRDLEVREAALAARKKKKKTPQRSAGIERESAEFRATRHEVKRKLRSNTAKQERLNAEIASLENQIPPLEKRLCDAVRKRSRLRLLIEGDYRLLDARKKSMMDALRISASNIFRNVQEQFRVICDNFRDDHVLVRMLSRSSGSMTRTSDTVTFKLWLPGQLQPHRIRAFETLLSQLEEQANARIRGPYKTIRLTLATGPLRV